MWGCPRALGGGCDGHSPVLRNPAGVSDYGRESQARASFGRSFAPLDCPRDAPILGPRRQNVAEMSYEPSSRTLCGVLLGVMAASTSLRDARKSNVRRLVDASPRARSTSRNDSVTLDDLAKILAHGSKGPIIERLSRHGCPVHCTESAAVGETMTCEAQGIPGGRPGFGG